MADSQPERAPYIFVVQMDIPAEHEVEFNRVYDTEHMRLISKVPGVRACYRYKLESSSRDDMARYMALYELDSPDIVNSEAWLAESEKGEWAPKIRPHTFNRGLHIMRRIR